MCNRTTEMTCTFDNQIKTLDRGTLSGGKTGISGTPSWEEDWNYDPTGNWRGSSTAYLTKVSGSTTLNRNRSYNEANEITNISAASGTSWPTPTHDAPGNMLTCPRPLSLGDSFDLKWDAWNRLVEVRARAKINSDFAGGDFDFWRGGTKEHSLRSVTAEQRSQKSKAPQPGGAGRRQAICFVARWSQIAGYAPALRLASGQAALPPKSEVIFARTPRNTGGSVLATYAYDGASRRVTKLTGGNTRHYYYSDQWQVLEERLNSSTSADRQFVWGIRSIDDLVLRDHDEERLYALHDAMSVTVVIDDAGAVQERYGYDGFGSPRYMTAAFGSRGSSDYEWETLFDAYRYDLESGLYQVRYRYLHPKLRRWVSRDPIGEIGFNLTRDVGNGSLQIQPEDVLIELSMARLDFDSFLARFEDEERSRSASQASKSKENLNLYAFVSNDPISRLDYLGLVWYGNFCGPGGAGIPIDALDQACKDHDDCYGGCGAAGVGGVVGGRAAVRACDADLCRDAPAAPCATLRCRAARAAVILIFCTVQHAP